MRFELFEHGADVGVRGFGGIPAEAFEGAALALFSLLAEARAVRSKVEVQVRAQAPGLEELLVAFLNELVSVSDVRQLVFGDVQVEIAGGPAGPYRLTALARGEPFDPRRHDFTVLPKGATFTELRVAREGSRWVAQCVVDV